MGKSADMETIDQVISSLNNIIDDCYRHNHQAGFFPALYRKVTVRVRDGIAANEFEDGERMERLDVVFAKRYIDAYHQNRRGIKPTRSWQYSFDMAEQPHPLILQHLLLGMNAHINLDLAIAAAQIAPWLAIETLRNDFHQINNVLAELTDEVQTQINAVSPAMNTLDRIGLGFDEAFCGFAMRIARGKAWDKARMMAHTPPEAQDDMIALFDKKVARYAQKVCPPKANALLMRVRSAENPNPREIINWLI